MSTGSQFRLPDNWVDNPLSGILAPFMNSISPVFGPQNIPFLSAITATTGPGNNALAAIPTVNIATPYMVKTLIAGDVDWVLETGVTVGTGYVAPNDQGISGKTWVSVS